MKKIFECETLNCSARATFNFDAIEIPEGWGVLCYCPDHLIQGNITIDAKPDVIGSISGWPIKRVTSDDSN